MAKLKSHMMNGKRFKVHVDREVHGYTGMPDDLWKSNPHKRGEIVVSSHLKARQFLETVVHEGTHAFFPNMTEEVVEAFGRDMGRLLWRLGYRRRVDEDE